MSYWLIGVPSRISIDAVNNATQQRGLSTNYMFPIPQLKVGTLDSLISLSEELQKSDPLVGGIVQKFEKAYIELVSSENTGEQTQNGKQQQQLPANNKSQKTQLVDLRIDDTTTPIDYIKKFKWNDIRFNKRVPLSQLVETAVNECVHADDDLKKKQAELAEIKAQISAVERIEFGSLQTRSLTPYIRNGDLIETDNMTTLIVVVPRSRQQEFEQEYGTWNSDAVKSSKQSINEQKQHDDDHDSKPLPSHIRPVVPGSMKLLFEDTAEDSLLYRVVVLKKGAEQYKQALRDRRLIVRQYSSSSESDAANKAKYEELKVKRKQLWNHLVRFTKTMYGELYVNYIHLKAIRLYVESVLRYGLPVDFKAMLMEPAKGKEKQLRDALKRLFQQHDGGQSKSDASDAEASMNGLDTEEFYPYVYIPLKVSD